MGADTKANTLELVRVPSSLLQRLQCGVALESLCDRGGSFGTEPVVLKTAERGVRRWGGEPCQRPLTLVSGCALQRGHGAPLERLTQFGEAVHGVGAFA